MISTFSKIFSKSRGKCPTVPRTPIPTHPLGIIQRIPVHRTGDMDGQRVSELGYYIMVERRQAIAFTHTMTTPRSVLWRWKMTLIRLAVEVRGVHTEKAFVACRFVNYKVTNDGPRRPSSIKVRLRGVHPPKPMMHFLYPLFKNVFSLKVYEKFSPKFS